MGHSRNRPIIKYTTVLLIMTMTIISLMPQVQASFVPSSQTHETEMASEDLEVVTKALENKVVKQRLQDLGYSPKEIQDRLSQLSEQEIHQLALKVESLTQGGILGAVIAVLVIVILVLVIMRLT